MNVERLQAFFFRAMSDGWIGSGKAFDCPDAPGYKAYSYRDGDFLLVDRYCSDAESPKSAGTTTIWHKDIPVWFMSYGGWYDKSTIACLKNALTEAYVSNQFVGGRGPLSLAVGPIVYANAPRVNDFEKFEGREEIHESETGTLLGFHEYRGMSLT